MSKQEVITNLEKTINKNGGDPKVKAQLKRKLQEVKRNDIINK